MGADKRRFRIAVDAMGGDLAPAEMIKGAIHATNDDALEVLLVGETDLVEPVLQQEDYDPKSISVVNSEGVIREDESPVNALRQKPNSSIAVSVGLVKNGYADACVTMGSTGAAVAASTFGFGLIPGVERPALAGPVIGFNPNVVLLDVGAGVDLRASQLLNCGIMGKVFAEKVLDMGSVSIGTLSVGSEDEKGNRQIKEAFPLFAESGMSFIGNVEGVDLFDDRPKVIVCDGFIGNILMKYTEGLGLAIQKFITEELGSILDNDTMTAIQQKIFSNTNVVESFGGGPLLGVEGITIIGHGRSAALAIGSAIKLAKHACEQDFLENMRQEIQQFSGANN